jgi:hypothetical protein
MLGERCFLRCKALSSVTLETGSKLSRIEASAFSGCSSLSSNCIPASIEIICERSSSDYQNLSNLTSETDTKLSRIQPFAFSNCSSLLQSGFLMGKLLQRPPKASDDANDSGGGDGGAAKDREGRRCYFGLEVPLRHE